jgi:hypothetical protein
MTKTIHNYRDEEWVRVIDEESDYYGKIYPVTSKNLENKTTKIFVGTEKLIANLRSPLEFNNSQLQTVFPDFIIDGHVLGVGDEIKNSADDIYVVYGSVWYDGEMNLCVYFKGNKDISYIRNSTYSYTLQSTIYKTQDPKIEEAIQLLKDNGYNVNK